MPAQRRGATSATFIPSGNGTVASCLNVQYSASDIIQLEKLDVRSIQTHILHYERLHLPPQCHTSGTILSGRIGKSHHDLYQKSVSLLGESERTHPCQGPPTRAPSLNRVTPGPNLTTVPTISCPGMKGNLALLVD
jgi:hypothetical protein